MERNGTGASPPTRFLRAAALVAVAGCLQGALTAARAEQPADAASSNSEFSTASLDAVPSREFLARVKSIADWVIENSSYEGYERLPAFVRLPDETLNYVFYSQTGTGYLAQSDVVALYSPQIILLSESFDIAVHEYTIVHELVHHLQFESGRKFGCPNEEEREAYEIQARWTKATGQGASPDRLFLLRLRCSPHP